MITKEQALTAGNFYTFDNGKWRNWRRNGQTKTWKTRPDDFKVPVKFGLYAYGYVTQDNAHLFFMGEHTEDVAISKAESLNG